jgi:OOP family OmpA-OmpF porin
MKTRTLLLAATMVGSVALAPDMAAAQPVTGLYVGGGGGANFLLQEHARSYSFGGVTTPAFGNAYADTGYVGLASIGYGLGNGLRFEVEGNYRYNHISQASTPGLISGGGREQKYGPMVNVLFDLDIGSAYAFPYIGAGAGYQRVDRSGTQTGSGSFNTPGGVVSSSNATVQTNGGDSSFAYQAIAGVAFPVPGLVGLSVTAEYRFFALTGDRSYGQRVTGVGITPLSGSVKLTDNYNHSVLLGLRYAFNAAPPPVAAPAPAAPEAQAARSYLVFFDWDRADLTDRARQIIAEAASATTKVQVTRIEVSGHTDSSGKAAYNQGLSVRRAQTVKTELVRLGVPAASIVTEGFGQTRPLVATAPGVREPQNRRVEIVLK